MAKHGLVSMTRAFRSSEPKVYETEGIKCYALCPTFVDTNLVRGAMTNRKENSNEEMGFKAGRGNITTLEQLEKSTKMRVMSVHEIGDAMMKSLKYDKVRYPSNYRLILTLIKTFFPFIGWSSLCHSSGHAFDGLSRQ